MMTKVKLKNYFYTFCCIITFLSFFALLAKHIWLAEILNCLRLQYIYVLIPALVLALYNKTKIFILIFSIGLFLNLCLTLNVYFPTSNKTGETKGELRLLQFNIKSSNQSFDAIIKLIKSEDPDIILILECSPKHKNIFNEFKGDYPYQIINLQNNNFGMALCSKIPFIKQEVFIINGLVNHYASFQINDELIHFIGTHPIPPMSPSMANSRKEHLDALTERVKQFKEGHIIVSGDFNLVPWSPWFTKFKKDSGLKDSRQGFGIHNSWSTPIPLTGIPIDHCFISQELYVTDRRICPKNGSDHNPIMIDLSW